MPLCRACGRLQAFGRRSFAFRGAVVGVIDQLLNNLDIEIVALVHQRLGEFDQAGDVSISTKELLAGLRRNQTAFYGQHTEPFQITVQGPHSPL